MKIQYISKSFRATSMDLINAANSIIREYQEAGYSLTTRQIYYQFVARDLIPNNMKSYRSIQKIINDGRLAGLIDWAAVVDRSRNLKGKQHWQSPQEIIEACSYSFNYDLWQSQEHRIEVWVEKEALIDVVGRACAKYDVSYFACKGYVSQSAQWEAGQRAKNSSRKTIVLHLGDHDPSGIDMTRDNFKRINMFSGFHVDVDVIRIALNMDQVEEYSPPPNPAKITDTRASGYIKKFGHYSWELDALEPSMLDGLISSHIESLMDASLMEKSIKRQEKARKEIKYVSDNWNTIQPQP